MQEDLPLSTTNSKPNVLEQDHWDADRIDLIETVATGARGERQRELFKNHFNWLKGTINVEMKRKWRLLEAGQGKFGFSTFYNQYFDKVQGADLLDFSHFHPGVDSITADFCKNIPIEEKSVNIIASHSVLEHVSDVEAALRNFDRVLKVGGFLFISISPLYYSGAGSHVNSPQKLENWEHLDPSNEYFNASCPQLNEMKLGTYLNKMTFSEFIGAIGKMPYSILGCKLSIDPRPIPDFIDNTINESDLRTKGFMLLAQKEWHIDHSV